LECLAEFSKTKHEVSCGILSGNGDRQLANIRKARIGICATSRARKASGDGDKHPLFLSAHCAGATRHLSFGQFQFNGVRMTSLAIKIVAILTGMLLPLHAAAAPGDLDPAFGEQGFFRLSNPPTARFSGRAVSVAKLANGNLLAAGLVDGFAGAWITSDGRLDISKPATSLVLVNPDSASERGAGIAALSAGDGRALFVRAQGTQGAPCTGRPESCLISSPDSIHSARFNSDGTSDVTWTNSATNPAILMRNPKSSAAADGGLYITGFLSRYALFRLNAQGVEDTAFNVLANSHPGCTAIDYGIERAVALPDGSVMAFSLSSLDQGEVTLCIRRLLASGQLDSAFGNAGQVQQRLSLRAFGGDLLLSGSQLMSADRTPDGRIHVVVKHSVLAPDVVDVVRLDGQQLSSTRIPSLPFFALTAAATDRLGRTIVAGNTINTTTSSFETTYTYGFTRILESGTEDTGFRSSSGAIVGPPMVGGQMTFVPSAIHPQADGSIYLAGEARQSGSPFSQFAIAKLQGDPIQTQPPPVQSSGGGGGGGGCGTLNGKGPVDPTLPLLAMLALLASQARRRIANIRSQRSTFTSRPMSA